MVLLKNIYIYILKMYVFKMYLKILVWMEVDFIFTHLTLCADIYCSKAMNRFSAYHSFQRGQ